MQRENELNLLAELIGLNEAKSAYLDEQVTSSPIERYLSADHYEREKTHVFRGVPLIAAHANELDGENTFLRRQISGLPVLFTRDGDGEIHAFLNVCRHRGARLVGEDSGCKKSFSCPYHAWTWTNRGDLRGIPHQQQGFPSIDKTKLGLKRLPVEERFGWIWIVADPEAGEMDLDGHLDSLAEDLAWLDLADHRIAQSETVDCQANWKLLVEGGIESYHFRVAHRDTIGPYFLDNLSSYQAFGHHLRSILPRAGLEDLANKPREDWSIRAAANIVYSVFPTSQFLVQSDHIVWIRLEALAAGRTMIHLNTLVPGDDDRREHWLRNHQITSKTLAEDFEIGESIQEGLASGANTELQFGRYEGALHRFNEQVDRLTAAR